MAQAQVIAAPIKTHRTRPQFDPALADQLTDALLHAERKLDDAFIAAAELTVMLPVALSETNLALAVPQNAIAAGATVIGSLTKARADLEAMHKQLARMRNRLGVPARMDGPLWKEDDEDPGTGEGGGGAP